MTEKQVTEFLEGFYKGDKADLPEKKRDVLIIENYAMDDDEDEDTGHCGSGCGSCGCG